MLSREKYNAIRGKPENRAGRIPKHPVGQLFQQLEKKWQNKRISRCLHSFPLDVIPHRAQGHHNQFWAGVYTYRDNPPREIATGSTERLWKFDVDDNLRLMKQFLTHMCGHLKDRFVVYGMIGRGSFGHVFMAREKQTGRRFAIKVLEARNGENERGRPRSEHMLQFPELCVAEYDYWTAREALVALYVLGHEELTQIDSVYLHPPLIAIVMQPFAVEEEEEEERSLSQLTMDHFNEEQGRFPEERMFPPTSGVVCSGGDFKEAMLNEVKVCKVASQLLKALTTLSHRNMTHMDLSARNYLVDGHCNAQLIDLDRVGLASEDPGGFICPTMPFVLAWEVFVTPELAVHLRYHPELGTKKKKDKLNPQGHVVGQVTDSNWTAHVPIRNDLRQDQLWHLGCIIFELIHAYAPWEHSLQNIDDTERARRIKVAQWYQFGCSQSRERARRHLRVINDDLQIREFQNLHFTYRWNNEDNIVSQDCKDVLRAMLSKDPENRPTLQELKTFPWFQGWWADRPEADFDREPPESDDSPTQPGTPERPTEISPITAPDGAGAPPAPPPAAPQADPKAPSAGSGQGTSSKAQDKGKEPAKEPDEAESHEPEIVDQNLIDGTCLPSCPSAVTTSAEKARFQRWKRTLHDAADTLVDQKYLLPCHIRRLLSINWSGALFPSTLAQAQAQAVKAHAEGGIQGKQPQLRERTDVADRVYTSFCILANSYFAGTATWTTQKGQLMRNLFEELSYKETKMHKGHLKKYLDNFAENTGVDQKKLQKERERLRKEVKKWIKGKGGKTRVPSPEKDASVPGSYTPIPDPTKPPVIPPKRTGTQTPLIQELVDRIKERHDLKRKHGDETSTERRVRKRRGDMLRKKYGLD